MPLAGVYANGTLVVLRYEHAISLAFRDNSCAPTACGRAIDRRAAPSRDEFPKLRIFLV